MLVASSLSLTHIDNGWGTLNCLSDVNRISVWHNYSWWVKMIHCYLSGVFHHSNAMERHNWRAFTESSQTTVISQSAYISYEKMARARSSWLRISEPKIKVGIHAAYYHWRRHGNILIPYVSAPNKLANKEIWRCNMQMLCRPILWIPAAGNFHLRNNRRIASNAILFSLSSAPLTFTWYINDVYSFQSYI